MLPFNDNTIFSVDVETTGKYWYKDKVFGVACCTFTEGKFYSEYEDIRQRPAYLGQVAEYMQKAPVIVNHNIKFDAHMLREVGCPMPLEKLDCTMVRASLIDEHLYEYSLDALCEKYLDERKVDIYPELAQLFGGKGTRTAQIGNLSKAPIEMARKYAIKDPELAIKLWMWQQGEIERQGLQKITAFEKKFLSYLIPLETGGIRVDVARAGRAIDELTTVINVKQKELNKRAGFEVNINATAQIAKMYDIRHEGGRPYVGNIALPLTGTGKPSFAKTTLDLINDEKAKLVLELRQMTKTRDTFLAGHILGHAVGGRVYPSVNQLKGDDDSGGLTGTTTGRLSYSEPALQQIPARNKTVARIVRPVFLPEEGQGWTYGDLDQHEFRVFVHYSKNPTLLRQYAEDADMDIHSAVADLTGLPRSATAAGMPSAKQLNLGAVFNMGGATIAKMMGMPTEFIQRKVKGVPQVDKEGNPVMIEIAGEEAQKIIDLYHRMIPGIKDLAATATSTAKARGYIRTLAGRHVRFPNPNVAYKACAMLYQSSSADLNKLNIMHVMDCLKGSKSRMLMNIHDEYSVTLEPGEEHLMQEAKRRIQDKPFLRVPIRIDFSNPSVNWWEATQAEKLTK